MQRCASGLENSGNLISLILFSQKTTNSFRVILVAVFFGFKLAGAQILFNEIMPANFDVIVDANTGNLPGWIEFYNASSKDIDLTHYYLSDDPERLNKWQIPYGTTIRAKSHLIIWCDGAPGILHTNFSLSRKTEYLVLSSPDGFRIDELYYPDQYNNFSYGRKSDGSSDWAFFSAPTPEGKNSGFSSLSVAARPVFETNPGVYSGSVSISFVEPPSGFINYTTDGTEPNRYSRKFIGSVRFESTVTIKAKIFEEGKLPSETTTGTFIINPNGHNMPILSISMDPTHLWDTKYGIYVEGTNGIPGNCSDARNWNREWNRHAVIEYFDSLGGRGVVQDVDVRIGGACSRNLPQKSLVIRARSKYGSNTIDHNFLPNRSGKSVGGFILRNSGNDFNVTQFRDAFAQHLAARSMDIDYLDYRPVVVYLNGVYWGIQNIREKADADYIRDNFGYDESEIDLLEVVGGKASVSGTWYDFDAYQNRLAQLNRTRPDAYQYMAENIDLDSYISYMVAEIYMGNTDWPGNNVRLWRPRIPGGKWRWVMWDLDFSFALFPDFTNAFHPGLTFATQADHDYWPNPAFSTLHFRLALDNPTFRTKFMHQMQVAMETVFYPDSVHALIDKFAERIAPEMIAHKQRWGGTIIDWQNELVRMKNYATDRHRFMKQHLIEFFGLTDESVPLNVRVREPETGNFQINGIRLKRNLFDGRLLKGSEVELKPKPEPGYRFSGWKITETGFNETEFIGTGASWKYFDQGSLPAQNWYAPAYSDDLWSAGTAELGYGDGDESTVVSFGSAPDAKFITTYFRKSFEVGDTTGLVSLKGQIKYDDGVVLYLNGAEVFRANLPAGPIDPGTLALVAEPEGVFVSFTLPVTYLKIGTNILAAEIHQISGLSSDISFDLKLTGTQLGGAVSSERTTRIPQFMVNSRTQIELIFQPDNRDFSGLVINEAGTDFTTKDRSYTGDWIELYNSGTDSLDLDGLFISDDYANPGKHVLLNPDEGKLPPGGFRVLFADGYTLAGGDHLNFKLSDNGEAITVFQLKNDTWSQIDSYSFETFESGKSWSRIPDGDGSFVNTSMPTPAAMNQFKAPEPGRVSAYPNPFKDLLFLDLPNTTTSVTLLDLMGRIQEVNLNAQQPYDVSSLAPGLYLLMITTDSGRQPIRLIKR